MNTPDLARHFTICVKKIKAKTVKNEILFEPPASLFRLGFGFDF